MNRKIMFKVTPSIKLKITKLAQLVGVKLNWERSIGIQYNGKDIACKGQDASDIIHDIAHYAVASKKARRNLDYGLGPGPGSSDYDEAIIPIYKGKKCQSIEEEASALGIYWEKQFGLPWDKTALYHSWVDDGSYKNLEAKQKSIKKIIKKYDCSLLCRECRSLYDV